MMPGSADETPTLMTLVLRVWRPSPSHRSFRFEATHVQTGDVAYFRSFDSAAHHIRCLIDRVSARGSSDHVF
jgi:hypothetical protein